MISVVCVAYNAEKYINDAINSILRQTFKELEIIVIDDGSTDKTYDLLKKYSHLNNIKIIRFEHTGNPGKLRNEAIKRSKYDIIAIIDSDDIWKPDKLEIQMKFHNDYDLICTNGERLYENNLLFDITVSSLSNLIFKKSKIQLPRLFFNQFDEDKDLSLEMMLSMNYIVTSSVLISKKAIQYANYFEENLGKRGEDYLLWLRIAKNGKIKFINKPLTIYRIHNDNLSHLNFEERYLSLLRLVDIRSAFLTDDSVVLRESAINGCVLAYKELRKFTFYYKYYDLSFKYSIKLLSLCSKRLSIEFIKNFIIFLYIYILKLIKNLLN